MSNRRYGVPTCHANMAPPFDPVSKIYVEREAWRLKVRIIRLWNVPAFNNSSQISSIEMVLLDEYGGKIQASVKKNLVNKFLPNLSEGAVYRMAYFTVVHNTGSYRATSHDYRLVFQFRTTITACESELIPLHGLSLIPFGDVYKHEGDSDFLVDVMGLLSGVSTEKQYERGGKMTKMVVMELIDFQGKLECTVFGDYVEELNAFLASGDLNDPVVVVQLAKIKLFRGNIVIQNVMNATKLMFNPDIAEAIEFRNGLSVHGLGGSQTLAVVPDGLRVSIEDDFMRLHVRKNMQQLAETKEDGMYIVLATINGVVEDDGWWYPACKCHRAVSPDSGLYYCDSCFCHVLNITPRYRIKLNVQDDNGCAVFVLFDRDAQQILHKACGDLVAEVQKMGKSGIDGLHPAVLTGLVGKKMLFKIEKKTALAAQFETSYRVRRVCEDDAILSMFQLPGAEVTPTKAKFTPPFPDICNLSSDFPNLDSVDPKELFNPPFPKVCNLGCDESQDASVAAEEFSSQVLDEVVCLGSAESAGNVNNTPAKRKLEEAMKFAVDPPIANMLKVVKIEKP